MTPRTAWLIVLAFWLIVGGAIAAGAFLLVDRMIAG